MYLEETRQMTIGQVSIYLYINESSFIRPTRGYVKVLLTSQKDMHNPCQGKIDARPNI